MSDRWSAHILKSETTCKCGCGKNDMDRQIIRIFENLRARVGNIPLTINSGFRCPTYNQSVGGKPESQHLVGKALDIKTPKDIKPKEFALYAELSGATGIGIYKTFIHIDCREGEARWTS